MNNLKRYTLAALAAALFAGSAHAGIVQASSDDKKVEVGESAVSRPPHVTGRPGIGLVDNEQLPRGIVDFQGLTAYAPADSHGVSSLTYPSSAPSWFPVSNQHAPLFRCFLDGQVEHLPGRVVSREYLASLGRFANGTVQRLDGMGGVNGFAYLRGILE